MDKTFTVHANSVDIYVRGCFYDLHNCFDFRDFRFDVGSKELILSFEVTESAARGFRTARTAERLRLVFSGVQYFELSPGFLREAPRDLEEVGYKSPEDRDDSWLTGEDKAAATDHLFLRFRNDEFIRLYSMKADCLVE